MIPAIYNKLDNPAWYALAETQKHFAIGNDEIKCYQKDIVAFAAFHSGNKNILNGLDGLIEINESFFIIGDLPALPYNYVMENPLPCLQMTCNAIITTLAGEELEKLHDRDEEQMTALVNLVHPGYYKPGTRLMGDYYGIKNNNQLVAMAGERIRMEGFTEISAVVTHPEFTGRKYAQQLVAHIIKKNLAAGNISFLHTAATNERAIKIYEYLGFQKRKIITFTKIKRIQ